MLWYFSPLVIAHKLCSLKCDSFQLIVQHFNLPRVAREHPCFKVKCLAQARNSDSWDQNKHTKCRKQKENSSAIFSLCFGKSYQQ